MKLSRGIRGGGGGNGERRNGSEQKTHFEFSHNNGFCGETSVSTRGLQTLNCRDGTDLRFLSGERAKSKGARGGVLKL